jgi:hypothetical protein
MLEKVVDAGYGEADNSAIFLAYDRPRAPDGLRPIDGLPGS